jgi:hypothetical protein
MVTEKGVQVKAKLPSLAMEIKNSSDVKSIL